LSVAGIRTICHSRGTIHPIAEQPRNAYEIAQAIWGNVAVTQAFLTLSEVIGHTDLLVNEGRIREVDGRDVIRYEANK
jgi:hypothetical protein